MVSPAESSLSIEEIEDNLQELLQNDAEVARICFAFDRLGCQGRCGMSSKDVFQQVALDSLEGIRAWKKGISARQHFQTNGRSIISRESEGHRVSMTDPFDEDITGHAGAPTLALSRQPSNAPEAAALRDEQERTISAYTQKIVTLFSEDEQALCYLKHCLEKIDLKSAIIECCNFSEKIYRNVRQRIKDKVRKRFPNGVDWWELS